MQSWNILFEVPGRGVAADPEIGWTNVSDENLLPRPDTSPDGFIGAAGPNIAWENWPRSTRTGLPMAHGFTLHLPTEYQRRGADFPAIAFFASEGQFNEDKPAVTGDASSDDPFLRDLAAASDHPGLVRKRDLIDGEWAIMWLTADETSAPVAAQPDLRRDGEHEDWSEGATAWGESTPTLSLWLAPRNDPNAGQAPRPHGTSEGEYTGVISPQGEGETWATDIMNFSHLGGTAFPVQALPDGLTPWYIEIYEFGPINFGSGSAQIDLESDTFDWAC